MPFNYCSIGFSEEDNIMLQDAENAINLADKWDYMRTEPGSGGYMFADDSELREIYKHIKYDGHSGASMGLTMRVMQQIAILGIDEFSRRRTGFV